jgi:hypothetical protein
MTSGALPPASVASNFFRWSVQVWYCTSTVTPGWDFSNWSLAAFTIGAQFSAWASTCSHTVMLSAFVPPEAVDATAARATPTRTAAPMMRALIMGDSPKRIGRRCASLGVPAWPTGNRRRSRLLVYTTLPRFGTVAQEGKDVKTSCRGATHRQIVAIGVFPGRTTTWRRLYHRSSHHPENVIGTDQRQKRRSSVTSL